MPNLLLIDINLQFVGSLILRTDFMYGMIFRLPHNFMLLWLYPAMIFSMTQVLTHTVAHSTNPSFRSKINNQSIKKFLSLTVTWVKVVKMCKILTCKINFLCQKWSESYFFFHSSGAHFLLLTIFTQLTAKLKNFFNGRRLVVGFGPKGRPCRMCNSVR